MRVAHYQRIANANCPAVRCIVQSRVHNIYFFEYWQGEPLHNPDQVIAIWHIKNIGIPLRIRESMRAVRALKTSLENNFTIH